jgi:hypothetical protein
MDQTTQLALYFVQCIRLGEQLPALQLGGGDMAGGQQHPHIRAFPPDPSREIEARHAAWQLDVRKDHADSAVRPQHQAGLVGRLSLETE